MLPLTEICGKKITRLIIGGNTISGTSHLNKQLDKEMEDYFTIGNVKKMFFRAMECGINTMQLRGDKHIMRIIREFRQEGGDLQWIAQTAPEFRSHEGNVAQMASYNPIMIYQHGVEADNLYKEGKIDEYKKKLDTIRATGLPVGLCTHMPEVVEYAEIHKWDVDFYMLSVFNVCDPEKLRLSEISGDEEPLFNEIDPPLMYEAIRSTKKPCLAFKILASSRRCKSQETVAKAFDEAYANIKPIDAVVVGMFPRDLDQVGLNCKYAVEAIRKSEANRS